MRGLLVAGWRPGPADGMAGPVLVSVTDFTSASPLDLPRVYRDGLRLRRGWPELEGAVGVWLWSLPLARRSGSVSVWQDRQALRRFVSWPPHVATMRRFRGRGELRSTTWEAEAFDATDVWRAARRWLAEDSVKR